MILVLQTWLILLRDLLIFTTVISYGNIVISGPAQCEAESNVGQPHGHNNELQLASDKIMDVFISCPEMSSEESMLSQAAFLCGIKRWTKS